MVSLSGELSNSTADETAERRILVTGGAGFIGSHLTRRLLTEGNSVIVADNFSSSTGANIADLTGHPGLVVLDHDVVQPLTVRVDQIYHLACPASPSQYQRDPIQTIRTCVDGSMNMLDLARRCAATVLLTSTSETYGDPHVHPQPETYWGNVNPIGPRSCYDEGKRCAEALFFAYRRMHDLPIKVARIFNTYGPNMDPEDGRVISNFVVAALRGKPLSIYGSGRQTRSFCYVADLVDGLCRLMHSPHAVTGPLNLGNPGEFEILDLAALVAELTGVEQKLQYHPLPEDDPQRRRPLIDEARRILGWRPTTSLREGLLATIDHMRARVDVSDPTNHAEAISG